MVMTMDYEKKYKAALERAKQMHQFSSDIAEIKRMEQVFPELKESEDERIRRELIVHFRNNSVSESWSGLNVKKVLAWLEKQGGKPQDKGEISDGYHTFNELYYYRMLYNAAFFNMLPKEWVHKSKKHHDGEDCFGGGWFIVMANLPTGQISNHYELKNWDLFQIPEKEVADKWDGHTPQEAADRLHKYLLEKQGEQETDEWKEGNIIRHGGILALVIRGRRVMKSNGEIFTVQYPDEWVKAAPKEIEHFLNEFEKQGEQPQGKTALEAAKEEKVDNQNCVKPSDKVEPKFKVKYAGNEYNVFETKDIAGVTFYGIEDEPNHIDYVKAENCEIISVYAIKENGSPYPTKPAVFSEKKPKPSTLRCRLFGDNGVERQQESPI